MANLNSVSIIGRVGQSPDIRYLPSGDPVANLSVATTETWKDKDGNKQETTEWHRCSAFRQPATFIEQYVNKGDLVFIEGKLQTREYEKNGEKRYTTEIVVGKFQLLSAKKAPSSASANPASASASDDDDAHPF